MMAPPHSAILWCSHSKGDKKLFATDPSRERERQTPKANASSLFLNHPAIKADCATVKFSPPKPKTTRPASITGMDLSAPPRAKMHCPPTKKTLKMTSILITPSLSTKYPPKNGRMMLGNE